MLNKISIITFLCLSVFIYAHAAHSTSESTLNRIVRDQESLLSTLNELQVAALQDSIDAARLKQQIDLCKKLIRDYNRHVFIFNTNYVPALTGVPVEDRMILSQITAAILQKDWIESIQANLELKNRTLRNNTLAELEGLWLACIDQTPVLITESYMSQHRFEWKRYVNLYESLVHIRRILHRLACGKSGTLQNRIYAMSQMVSILPEFCDFLNYLQQHKSTLNKMLYRSLFDQYFLIYAQTLAWGSKGILYPTLLMYYRCAFEAIDELQAIVTDTDGSKKNLLHSLSQSGLIVLPSDAK